MSLIDDRCPVCGSKGFISHDIVDGFDFGWSVGCPRACIADGVHGFDTAESFERARLVFFTSTTKIRHLKFGGGDATMRLIDADRRRGRMV